MSLRERLTRALAMSPDLSPEAAFVDLRPDPSLPLSSFAPAAVLIAFTDGPVPGMIFTQRPAAMNRHAGQVAFPGGRLDPEDADGVAGALREAREEIALPPEQVDVLGALRRYRTGTGFEIEPIVGIVPQGLPLVAASGEVDAIFEVPLDYLLDPLNRIQKTVQWEGKPRSYYEILWEEWRIWGITAHILIDLMSRISVADAARQEDGR